MCKMISHTLVTIVRIIINISFQKVAPAPNVDSNSEKVTMHELQKKEEGYDNTGFENEEEPPPTTNEIPENANQPKTPETDRLQESDTTQIERLKLESRAGPLEKASITDREGGDHNWHEVKSI